MKKLLLLIVMLGVFTLTSCTNDDLVDESETEFKQDVQTINHDEIGGSTDEDDTNLDTAGD